MGRERLNCWKSLLNGFNYFYVLCIENLHRLDSWASPKGAVIQGKEDPQESTTLTILGFLKSTRIYVLYERDRNMARCGHSTVAELGT